MESGPVISSGGGGGSSGSNDGANAKRKLDTVQAHAQDASSLYSSSSQSPSAAKPIIPMDSQPKVRRRGSSMEMAFDPSLKRCYSDGKISQALGDLVTGDEQRSMSVVYPKSPSMGSLPAIQQIKTMSPRGEYSPRFGMNHRQDVHHTHFVSEETCSTTFKLGPFSSTVPQTELDPALLHPETHSPAGECFSRIHSADSLGSPLHVKKVLPSVPTTLSHQHHLAFHSEISAPTKPSSSLAIDLDLSNRNNNYPSPKTTSGHITTPSTTIPRSSSSLPKRTWHPTKKNRNPGNLSLDLSQMDQPVFDPSNSGDACLRRNDQAAVCSRVTDFLYIGGAAAAKDKDALTRFGITHIINCAATVAPDFFPDDFLYFNVRLRDHSSQDIARHFYNIFDFIEKARRRGGRIFVHCVKGISRSPTMAIAYLMWYKRIGMYKALDFVRQARPVVDPNAGFIFQLTEWEHLHAGGKIQFHRTIVFRIEVARESNGNGNSTRAAEKPLIVGPLTNVSEEFFHQPSKENVKLSFVVACADCMFIWCGAEVSDIQVEAAQHATVLLQDFESFPEKCEIVYQNQESSAFWNLIDNSMRPDDS